MKNYYQQKKGGWSLEPVIYAKTIKQIRCYRFFQSIIKEYEAMSPERRTERSMLDKIVAERYMQAIEEGLRRYVPAEYRPAVFAHLVDDVEYTILEEKHFVSASTLKRYVQVFVWGVAEELGENFSAWTGRL